MGFPCSVNTFLYVSIWRTKKVTRLSTNDTLMCPWNRLRQLDLMTGLCPRWAVIPTNGQLTCRLTEQVACAEPDLTQVHVRISKHGPSTAHWVRMTPARLFQPWIVGSDTLQHRNISSAYLESLTQSRGSDACDHPHPHHHHQGSALEGGGGVTQLLAEG